MGSFQSVNGKINFTKSFPSSLSLFLLKLDFPFNFSGVAEVLSLHWSLDRCGGRELKEGDFTGFESNQM